MRRLLRTLQDRAIGRRRIRAGASAVSTINGVSRWRSFAGTGCANNAPLDSVTEITVRQNAGRDSFLWSAAFDATLQAGSGPRRHDFSAGGVSSRCCSAPFSQAR